MQTRIAANAPAMKRWLDKAEVVLGNHSDRLNAINIFPVADGDTGTNLYLTVCAGARAARAADTADLGELLTSAGRAAMEDARGNSGTLFAVFLSALAEPLHGTTRLTARLLASSLHRAQLRSWSALSDPVPGTMLSVLEAAAGAAADTAGQFASDESNNALALTLQAMVQAALEAVVNTESQLGPLTEAKIVDAGGVGLLLILDALRAASLGEELQHELLDGLHGYDIQSPHIHAGGDAEGVEIMCTINLSPLEAATLRLHLDEVGDSVIMSAVSPVDDGYRWRVHVHAADPGPAMEYINAAGSPVNVAITRLSSPATSPLTVSAGMPEGNGH